MKNNNAFSLIELLIVAAVIGVLAGIAVPNVMLAMTRAKIARAQADHKNIATALEAYNLDYGQYPSYGNPRDFSLFAGEAVVYLPVHLTTPVSYLSTLPPDIFPGFRTGKEDAKQDTYFYMHNYETVYQGKTQAKGHVETHFRTLTGSERKAFWTVWSYGPDLDDDHGIKFYEASNGIISNGDMMRFGP